MLGKFNRRICELLEAVTSRPAPVSSSPRNKPSAQGGKANRRPFYYDAEDVIDKEVKQKTASGLLGKIDALHAASTGKGDTPGFIDALRTPSSEFATAAKKELFVARSIERMFGLIQPKPETRQNLFRDKHHTYKDVRASVFNDTNVTDEIANSRVYYNISQAGTVSMYNADTKKWDTIKGDTKSGKDIITRVQNASEFVKNPGRRSIPKNLPK